MTLGRRRCGARADDSRPCGAWRGTGGGRSYLPAFDSDKAVSYGSNREPLDLRPLPRSRPALERPCGMPRVWGRGWARGGSRSEWADHHVRGVGADQRVGHDGQQHAVVWRRLTPSGERGTGSSSVPGSSFPWWTPARRITWPCASPIVVAVARRQLAMSWCGSAGSTRNRRDIASWLARRTTSTREALFRRGARNGTSVQCDASRGLRE